MSWQAVTLALGLAWAVVAIVWAVAYALSYQGDSGDDGA